MALINLTFNSLNTSLQVGDTAWYVATSNNTANTEDIVKIGEVKEINNNTIVVNSVGGPSTIGTQYSGSSLDGFFIMFSKNNKANLGDIKGYYAEVKLVNESTKKAEVFSLGSEISQSSK
tara:strand:+ start:2029 stop:2388 length:360 start_codon:yes stop_codon:yes gene_type:complete